jgi:hypothetical protein
MRFMLKLIDETQNPITLEHASKGKSIELSILLPLRAICFCTLQCGTPCTKSLNLMAVVAFWFSRKIMRRSE